MTIKDVSKYKPINSEGIKRAVVCYLLMLVPLSIFAQDIGATPEQAGELKTTVIIILIGALGWVIQMYVSDKKRAEKDQADINKEYLIALTELKDTLKSFSKEIIDLKKEFDDFKTNCIANHKK